MSVNFELGRCHAQPAHSSVYSWELVVEIPPVVESEFRAVPWEVIGSSGDSTRIYRRHISGLAAFYSRHPERAGFGNRWFKWEMADGSTLEGGAWSSNCGVINRDLMNLREGRHNIVQIAGLYSWGRGGGYLGLQQAYTLLNKWWSQMPESDWYPVWVHNLRNGDNEIQWKIAWTRKCYGEIEIDVLHKNPSFDSESLDYLDWYSIIDEKDPYLKSQC